MKTSSKVSLAVLAGALVLVAALIMREALGGVTFRAADYDTIEECMASIPQEWRLGSLERTRAESACHYEAQRRRERGS